MHHAIPFIATISNQPPPLESPFGLSHAGPPRITSSRFPSQSHSSYHVPSFASYVCVVQWNVKRLFYEADIGLHSKLMRMIVPIVQRTSSKHNRKFPPITYSPRSNRFLLRFIPSIFPSLFALASSIYPLGKLGHSGMDLSKWKRNLANGRKEERERERRSYYLSASNPNYKRLATNRVRDHRWGRSFGLFERIACDCLFIPATTFSFFEPAFLSDVYALQRRGALPLPHCPRRTKTDDSNCFSS